MLKEVKLGIYIDSDGSTKYEISSMLSLISIFFNLLDNIYLKLIPCIVLQVDHMVYEGKDLSSIILGFKECNESEFARAQFEGLRMDSDDYGGVITPNSILEDPLHFHGASSCSSHDMGSSSIAHQAPKKKKGSGYIPGIMCSLGNRRKGAPQRSPLS